MLERSYQKFPRKKDMKNYKMSTQYERLYHRLHGTIDFTYCLCVS